jgi:hypothetical protein
VDTNLNASATFRVSNFLNVEQNFWGSADINVIRDRIFDFDDWNSYAIAQFLPYYLQVIFPSLPYQLILLYF